MSISKHISGIANKAESNCILAVDTNINAGNVLCNIKLEMVFPSFTEMKLNFFNKKPEVITKNVSQKTLSAI